MTPDDLLTDPPRALLERPLADYRALFADGVTLADEHLESLDYILLHRVVGMLVCWAAEPELAEAEDAIRRLFPPSWRGTPWAARWLGLADALDARRAMLREGGAVIHL